MSKQPNDKDENETGKARLSKALIGALIFVIAMVLLLAWAFEPNASQPGIYPGGQQSAGEEDKPFYSVDPSATGALTLDELQINIPAELAQEMTQQSRACYLQKIGDLAAAAGDPEMVDPADVAYLPTDGSWADLTVFDRRNILAQAIVSHAITFC